MKSPDEQFLTLVVLAAGVGNRFGGNKQLEEVGPSGETLMDYAVYDAWRAGFNKVVFVIREELKELFESRFGEGIGQRLDVKLVVQRLDDLPAGYEVPKGRTKPWGTGQAVLSAKGTIDGPFVVINGDDFYGAESFNVLAEFLRSSPITESSNSYAMVGFRLKKTLSENGTVSRGICEKSKEGKLKRIEEVYAIEQTAEGARSVDASGPICDYTGKELVSMNIWGFTPSLFGFLEAEFDSFLENLKDPTKAEFYIPKVIAKLIQSEKATVEVLETTTHWMGITYKNDKPLVTSSINRLIDENKYPSPLWQNA